MYPGTHSLLKSQAAIRFKKLQVNSPLPLFAASEEILTQSIVSSGYIYTFSFPKKIAPVGSQGNNWESIPPASSVHLQNSYA
jgi:hypothetical protein